MNSARFLRRLFCHFGLILICVCVLISCSSGSPVPPNVPDESVVLRSEIVEEKPAASATITLCGDILIHNTVARSSKSGDGYDFEPIFSAIKPLLAADVVIGNLESPVDAYGDNQKISSYPRFNAPNELIGGLKNVGFTTLITANNHALDQYYSGLARTRALVLEAGITPVGTYADRRESEKPVILEANGIKIGIAAWTDSDNGMGGGIDQDKRDYVLPTFSSQTTDDVDRMTADIVKLKEAGAEFIIFSLHWGAEYADAPTNMQKQIARALVDAGADVIMGNHAHCVQPIERYSGQRDGLIIYSLGNFIADQFALNMQKTARSMIVRITVTRDAGDQPAVLADACYIPTVIVRHSAFSLSGAGNGFRIYPAKEYADVTRTDGVPKGVTVTGIARDAYDAVFKIVGDVIESR